MNSIQSYNEVDVHSSPIHSLECKEKSKISKFSQESRNAKVYQDYPCNPYKTYNTSSTCNSDDSGFDRTQNLSPTSPLPGESDSEDNISTSDSLHHSETGQSLKQPFLPPYRAKLLYDLPNWGKFNVAENAQFSPSGVCYAAPYDYFESSRSTKLESSLAKKSAVKVGENDNRFHILSYKQVTRLDAILTQLIPIYSRQSGLPTILVRLNELFTAVEKSLQQNGLVIRDLRLNGGAASHALSAQATPQFNDIDVLILLDLSSEPSTIQRVKHAVLDALMSFIPKTSSNYPADTKCTAVADYLPATNYQETSHLRNPEEMFDTIEPLLTPNSSDSLSKISSSGLPYAEFRAYSQAQYERYSESNNSDDFSFRETYIYKQFRKFANRDADCWSLLSLGVPSRDSKVIEFKFVDRMRRQFEFTVDSFQISLEPIISFRNNHRLEKMTQNFFPTVVAECLSGSFSDAYYHLRNKLILTTEPEMIRGGGLLKYCRLLVNGYQPPQGIEVSSLERYMSSRFFIDFQDIESQSKKIQAFLVNHFTDNESEQKIIFLRTIYRVVSGSTICLMSFERYQTLNLVNKLIQYNTQLHQQTIQSNVLTLDGLIETQNMSIASVHFGTDLFPVINQTSQFPSIHPKSSKHQLNSSQSSIDKEITSGSSCDLTFSEEMLCGSSFKSTNVSPSALFILEP